MQLTDYLRAINQTKEDVITKSDAPETAAKLYPQFVVARSLSYYPDTVFLINEINRYQVENKNHFDFCLNLIPKGKRFAKWAKPEKSDVIKKIVEVCGLSYDKAKVVANVLSREQIDGLLKDPEYGGVIDKKK